MLIPRRKLLQNQALLGTLACGLWLLGCKHSKKNPAPPSASGLPEPGSGGDDELPPATKEESPTAVLPLACSAAGFHTVVLDKIPNAAERFTVNYKCYGSPSSSLLALEFPKYAQGDLQDVYLADGSGKLLAQYGVSQGSEGKGSLLRPLLFDGLRLAQTEPLTVLVYTVDERFYKISLGDTLKFEDSFGGMKAYGLSPLGEAMPDFAQQQALPLFVPDADLYFQQSSSDAAFITKPQFTIDALAEIPYPASEDLKGYTITDIMGRVISEYGERFDALFEYPYFICYRLIPKRYYLRTFIRMT